MSGGAIRLVRGSDRLPEPSSARKVPCALSGDSLGICGSQVTRVVSAIVMRAEPFLDVGEAAGSVPAGVQVSPQGGLGSDPDTACGPTPDPRDTEQE